MEREGGSVLSTGSIWTPSQQIRPNEWEQQTRLPVQPRHHQRSQQEHATYGKLQQQRPRQQQPQLEPMHEPELPYGNLKSAQNPVFPTLDASTRQEAHMEAAQAEGNATCVVLRGLQRVPFVGENMSRGTSTPVYLATKGPGTLRPSAMGQSHEAPLVAGQNEVGRLTYPDENIPDGHRSPHVSAAARVSGAMAMTPQVTHANNPERAGIIRQIMPPSPAHRPNGPRALFPLDETREAHADAEVARQPQLLPALRRAAEMSTPSLVARSLSACA